VSSLEKGYGGKGEVVVIMMKEGDDLKSWEAEEWEENKGTEM